MNKGILASAVSAALLTGVAVNAHHSLSGVYDIRGSGEVTGTVVKVEFVNPHGAMTIAVDNTDGTKTEWVMTTGSANTLQSLGFGQGGPNTVVAGDVVTIGYFPARNGKPLGFIRSITLPNATTIEFEPE
jgi:DNA/RNA endonuclease YhcR with UshA esterase domain